MRERRSTYDDVQMLGVLTACKGCKHEGEYSPRDGFTCRAPKLFQFLCHEGTIVEGPMLCSDVNTDGHCDPFKAKDER